MYLFDRPDNAHSLIVLAHGASVGMRHRSMVNLSAALNAVGIATLRYNFPYMDQLERGEKITGQRYAKPPLLAAVKMAAEEGSNLAPDLPLFAGGRSMGGRMTSMAEAESHLANVRGIVFFGFPLHPSGKPGTERAEHLYKVQVPMLFVQGTGDLLATPELLRPIVTDLGSGATLFEIYGADHSFHVPKSSGMTDAQVLDLIAEQVATWSAATSVGTPEEWS